MCGRVGRLRGQRLLQPVAGGLELAALGVQDREVVRRLRPQRIVRREILVGVDRCLELAATGPRPGVQKAGVAIARVGFQIIRGLACGCLEMAGIDLRMQIVQRDRRRDRQRRQHDQCPETAAQRRAADRRVTGGSSSVPLSTSPKLDVDDRISQMTENYQNRWRYPGRPTAMLVGGPPRGILECSFLAGRAGWARTSRRGRLQSGDRHADTGPARRWHRDASVAAFAPEPSQAVSGAHGRRHPARTIACTGAPVAGSGRAAADRQRRHRFVAEQMRAAEMPGRVLLEPAARNTAPAVAAAAGGACAPRWCSRAAGHAHRPRHRRQRFVRPRRGDEARPPGG